MDIDGIAPGIDFDEEIRRTLDCVDAMLVVIGRYWLDAADASGNRRLDDAEDYVRLEIATALNKQIRVIPVLVGKASAPKPNALPDNIRGLARRQAVELSDSRWEYDTGKLIESLSTGSRRPPVALPPAGQCPLIGLWENESVGAMVTLRQRYDFRADGSYQFTMSSGRPHSPNETIISRDTGSFTTTDTKVTLTKTLGDANTVEWRIVPLPYGSGYRLYLGSEPYHRPR